MNRLSQETEKRVWHVIYIRPNYERKVSAKLMDYGIEHFLPRREEVRQWHDRKKKIQIPLFPGYVFVRVNRMDTLNLYLIDGFIRFLVTGDEIDVLSDEEMEAIIQLFQEDYQISSTKLFDGAPVLITAGSLKGLNGIMSDKVINGQATLHVEILNKFIRVVVPANTVEPLEGSARMAS